jgi:hypothetical protein
MDNYSHVYFYKLILAEIIPIENYIFLIYE